MPDMFLFDTLFGINYIVEPSFFGSLNDLQQANIGFGSTLNQGLQQLFANHQCGILIANNKSFAVMSFEGKFYLADSHSCGPSGTPAANGKACVIECDTLQELSHICKSVTTMNGQYTIDFVEVIVKNDMLVITQNVRDNPHTFSEKKVMTLQWPIWKCIRSTRFQSLLQSCILLMVCNHQKKVC